jgi:hypothetical protein
MWSSKIPPYLCSINDLYPGMLSHLVNELMNLFAGNSRYVHYNRRRKVLFITGFILFLSIPILLSYFL